MPHPLEYAVKDALMMCDKGATPGQFTPNTNTNITISGALVATEFDKAPLVHVPCFGACAAKGGSACTPAPIKWMDTYSVRVKQGETLLFKSSLPCSVGGKIEFLTSGQVPLPPGELEALMEEFGEEEEEEGGWGWWDTAELIPVVGNVIGMVREAKKGNWGMFALNAVFLVVDVATLGAGSAVTTPLKGGIKAGVKVTAKTAAKTAAKRGARELAEGAAKGFAKAVARSVDNLAAKGGVCVFACFPAGTLVATEEGTKPIEDVAVGDEVWAANEVSGERHPKRVVNTMRRTVDATVLIKIAEETIETTAEHPFWTRSGWKEAAKLQSSDELMTREGHWHAVQSVAFAYVPKEVYNFEVAEYHTYFVGQWNWWVHNSNPCVSNGIRRINQIATKPFKRNPKHSLAEFSQQVADQQKGLNRLSVDDFLKNRDAYLRNGRSSSGSSAQAAFRTRAHADKVGELRRANPNMSRKEAQRQADLHMKSRAALHDPDQIAGGFGHNVNRLGDRRVNSSLGSQWKSRIGDVDSHVRQQAQGMTEAQRKSTFLNVDMPIQ